MVNNNVADNLRHIRILEEVRQGELAARLGITNQMLCQIERGKKAAPPERLRQLAEFYGCTVEELSRDGYWLDRLRQQRLGSKQKGGNV